MSNWDEFKRKVKEKANGQIETICRKLLPNGKKVRNEWQIGSVTGEEGQSMRVTLTGQNRGLWYDHATAEGGDIFSLWAMNKAIPFVQALDEVAAFVGETRVRSFTPKPKPKPYTKDGMKPMRGSPVMEYMNKRGLKEQILKKYNIRSHEKGAVRYIVNKTTKEKEHPDFLFKQDYYWLAQYEDSVGDRVMLKSLGIEKVEGKHDIWTTPPYYTLWGWWTVKPTHKEVVACEGEIDAMSVAQMLDEKIPVMSLPNGAGNDTWIENDLDALNQFDKIYLVMDQDKPNSRGIQPGEHGAKKLAERLGRARCFRVRWPEKYKDPNQLLQEGTDAEKNFQQYLDSAETYTPPSIRDAQALEEVTTENRKRRLQAIDEGHFAFDVPFIQMDGEVTIFQGMSGSGKSDSTYQVAVEDMEHGHRILFCSLEIPADEMLEIMATQYTCKRPNDMEIKRFVEQTAGKLWFMEDHEDTITPRALLNDIEYAACRFGVTRVFIDSLHFVVSKDDYQGQDDFVKSIKKLAKKLNIHITLIAHSRYKEGGEHWIPKVDDIEGSKGMIKPVQNILAIWRNIPKEDAKDDPDMVVNSKGEPDHDKYLRLMDQPDAYLVCYKQRNGHRKRFKQGLWYDFISRRFRTEQYAVKQPVEHKEALGF